MVLRRRRRIALVWSQFAAYHVDRCEAVAARLADRFDVDAVEVASTSFLYDWEPSGEVRGARKTTLFPKRAFESIPVVARFAALFRVLIRCDVVFFGIGYNEPEIIALSWILPLFRVCVVMMSDSKFEDHDRTVGFEALKAAVLASYRSGIVAGSRQRAYFNFLGFRSRRLVPGYDSVGIARIRAQAGGIVLPQGRAFAERPFLFVGRFVPKKNLLTLIEAYAQYVRLAGAGVRRLVLVGDGPMRPEIEARLIALDIAGLVDLPGFLTSAGVSQAMSEALALFLVSKEEQWGLVVNEALALGLPLVVSRPVGAADILVRNLVNGYVVEPGSRDGIVQAMLRLSASEDEWRRMVGESHKRSWMADSARFADAVDVLVGGAGRDAAGMVERFGQELGGMSR